MCEVLHAVALIINLWNETVSDFVYTIGQDDVTKKSFLWTNSKKVLLHWIQRLSLEYVLSAQDVCGTSLNFPHRRVFMRQAPSIHCASSPALSLLHSDYHMSGMALLNGIGPRWHCTIGFEQHHATHLCSISQNGNSMSARGLPWQSESKKWQPLVAKTVQISRLFHRPFNCAFSMQHRHHHISLRKRSLLYIFNFITVIELLYWN